MVFNKMRNAIKTVQFFDSLVQFMRAALELSCSLLHPVFEFFVHFLNRVFRSFEVGNLLGKRSVNKVVKHGREQQNQKDRIE